MADHRFPVDGNRVLRARINAWTYFLWPLGIIAFILLTSDGFFPDPRTDSLAWFPYLFIAGLSLPMVLIGVHLLRRVPKGAAGGRLRLDDDGLDYRVGPFAVRLSWAGVGAVHVHRSDFDGTPRALWLAHEPGPEPAASRLRRMLGNRLARPVETAEGTLVPLLLFSADDARAILVAARDLHARSQG